MTKTATPLCRRFSMKKKIFCIANAANYLHRALTFAESVKKVYEEEAVVVCCVVERDLDFLDTRKYSVIDKFLSVKEVGIPDFDYQAFKHNLIEMSCFVRPFLMETVFNIYPEAEIFYFMDCDTWLESRLYETDEVLTKYGFNIALTPHTVDPPDYQYPEAERISERAYLRHGTFNLGFLGIANNSYAKEIITKWWKERVTSSCFWDIAEGVFVDQKWWNIVPYMFKGIYVEKSRGYNYASWAIMRRTIEKKGNCYKINGDPLRFGHFSATFNGHLGYATVYGIENRKEMLRTLSEYCTKYYKRIHYYDKARFSQMNWSLGYFQNGQEIMDATRTIYRKQLSSWFSTNPYTLSNDEINRLSGKEKQDDRKFKDVFFEVKKVNHDFLNLFTSRACKWASKKMANIRRKLVLL
jgi:hypothetical protein